jgi:trimeric autotransporter adhesin
LSTHGFRVNKVGQARTFVDFSGTVGQLREAFHTSIHSYVVNGKSHYANATNPQIPAALADVVGGVTQLHNFNPRPSNVRGPDGMWDAEAKRLRPQMTWKYDGQDNLYLVPADAATIYNTPNAALNPNYTGKTYDGTGVTIGIVGDSNFTMQDVANYRAFFLNDTSTADLPNVIVDGNDPGVNGDAVESLLDTEIAGGIAPKAKINFYVAEDTDLQAGLVQAIFRALEDNAVDILNVSFGGCEAGQGQAGNLQNYMAWQQAAAQGISVTVSTGDSGSADCDNPDVASPVYAEDGLAVNGLATTPYNVAVGGTDFAVLNANYPDSFNQYMNSSGGGVAPYFGSVAGYIPETPWNDSTVNNGSFAADTAQSDGNQNIAGGGGGMSSCSSQDESGDCAGGYPKPAFQTALTPNDGVRDIPDVSLFASNGYSNAIWALCSDNVADGKDSTFTDCQLTDGKVTSGTLVGGVGGTSAAAPAFAGILALVNQKAGGRIGNPNPMLYVLGQYVPPAFHDVTVGNNSVNCDSGSANCGANGFLTGYDAGPGYDMATGLGSVNAASLVDNWPSAPFNPSSISLQLGPNGQLGTGGISVTHGATLSFSASVDPSAATGNISLVTDSDVTKMPDSGGPQNNVYTLSTGTVSGVTNSLPGGSYNVYAYYGGDGTYGASKSNAIPVTITPESSQTTLSLNFIDPIDQQPASDSTVIPYGFYFFATATPTASSGVADGVATGTVTLLNNGKSIGPAVALNSQGKASYNVYDQNPLPPGTYQLVASYSGDDSYKPSQSAVSMITVTKGQTQTVVNPSLITVDANGSETFTATVIADSIGDLAGGTVTIQTGSTVLGSATMTSSYQTANNITSVVGTASIAVAANKFPQNGTNSVVAIYSGDTNYATSTSGAVGITVTGLSAPGFMLKSAANVTIASPGGSGNSTITVAPLAGFTGSVVFSCSVVTAPANAVSVPGCAAASTTIAGTSAVTATLTIDSTSTTTPGSYVLNVVGKDEATGKLSSSKSMTVTVNAAPTIAVVATAVALGVPGDPGSSTVSVTPSNGFTGAVNFACTVTSAPVGAVSAPACSTASVSVTGTTTATGSLPVSTTSTTTAGTYTLAVTGTDAATGKVSASAAMVVTVGAAPPPPAPAITLGATAVKIANPGNAASSTVTVTPVNGFTGAAQLSCVVTSGPSGAVSAPVCASASANVTGAATATSTVSVETAASTTPGTYTLLLTATAPGVISASVTLSVVVDQGAAPSFTLSAKAVNVSLGGSGTSPITVTPAGGFSGQVNLKCALSSAPSGVTTMPACSFDTGGSVIIGGSAATATLTITTPTSASAVVLPAGTRWLEAAGGVAVAGLLWFGVPGRRRRWPALLAVLLMLGSMAMTGCGGGSSSGSSAPATGQTTTPSGVGAYAFTVSGADAATGAVVSSTTVTVNVQ